VCADLRKKRKEHQLLNPVILEVYSTLVSAHFSPPTPQHLSEYLLPFISSPWMEMHFLISFGDFVA
jgi:hypothetical protein